MQVAQYFKCRKTILELLKTQHFDTSGYENFSMNEVNVMMTTNQLDMLMRTVSHAPVQRKVYVRFAGEKTSVARNIQETVDDLFVHTGTLEPDDVLYIITKDGMKPTLVPELTRMWERDRWLVIVEGMKSLQFNILEHYAVPQHIILTDAETVEVKKQFNVLDEQFPEISRFDPVARAIGLRPGQLCRIIRPSKTSVVSDYYRMCV